VQQSLEQTQLQLEEQRLRLEIELMEWERGARRKVTMTIVGRLGCWLSPMLY
jgi:hypothetical protein